MHLTFDITVHHYYVYNLFSEAHFATPLAMANKYFRQLVIIMLKIYLKCDKQSILYSEPTWLWHTKFIVHPNLKGATPWRTLKCGRLNTPLHNPFSKMLFHIIFTLHGCSRCVLKDKSISECRSLTARIPWKSMMLLCPVLLVFVIVEHTSEWQLILRPPLHHFAVFYFIGDGSRP